MPLTLRMPTVEDLTPELVFRAHLGDNLGVTYLEVQVNYIHMKVRII